MYYLIYISAKNALTWFVTIGLRFFLILLRCNTK